MILEWDGEAVGEYAASARYYEGQREGLGDEFIDCVEATAARILRNPAAPRVFDHGCRKVQVSRFPFALIYALDGEAIRVVAVMHLHREPGYWYPRA